MKQFKLGILYTLRGFGLRENERALSSGTILICNMFSQGKITTVYNDRKLQYHIKPVHRKVLDRCCAGCSWVP